MGQLIPQPPDDVDVDEWLDGLSPKERRAYQRLQRVVTGAVVEQAIRVGDIDPQGKSDSELRDEVIAYLRAEFSHGKRVEVVIDHTSTLLRQARQAHKAGDDEIAVILYATWVEHFVNKIVLTGSERCGLSREHGYEMLRDVSLRGKVTWLLPLVGFRAIGQAHLKTLTTLSERRNQYVHYKWKGLNESRSEARSVRQLIETTEKTVRYLRRYERSVVFGDRLRMARGAADPVDVPSD
jgi:hypothetical protein